MNKRSSGIMLLELMVSVVVIAIVINLSLSIFVSISRLSALETKALDRLRAVDEVREAFTRTVREAAAVVPGVGAYKTGDGHLVLAMPPSPGEEARYVVLGPIKSPNKMSRLEVSKHGDQYVSEAYQTYALPAESFRFSYDKPDAQELGLAACDHLPDERPAGLFLLLHVLPQRPGKMKSEFEPRMVVELLEEGLIAVAESHVEDIFEIAHRLVVMDGHQKNAFGHRSSLIRPHGRP